MDFSAWDWAKGFRLHEAACLIAGVMPVTKKTPSTEELPPQARPILIVLMSAYFEWLLQQKNPQRTKAQVLEGRRFDDGSLPPFPSLQTVVGEFITRKAIHRFLSETGRNSVYDFKPIAHTTSVLDGTSNAQTDEVALQAVPVVEAPESETPEQRRARWLDWYAKGERGAVQRVYKRERLLNPKADRAYIGKQIKIAKAELADKKRGGAWVSQLVQDGKR